MNINNLSYLGTAKLKNGKTVELYTDYCEPYEHCYRKQNGKFIFTWLPWQNPKKSPISRFLTNYKGEKVGDF